MSQDKVEAIQTMPVPTNVDELRKLLELVNFYAPFIVDVAKKTADLYELLKKTVS